MRKIIYFPILFITLFIGCKKPDVAPEPVDPKDPDALSKVIVFTGNTQNQSGTMPTTTSPTTTITNNPSVSLTTGGSNVYIPIQYTGNTPITAANVKIVGASSYFTVPVNGAGSSGLFYIPMSLPSSVLQGEFALQIVLVGANGNIILTRTINVNVKITLPKECGSGQIVGSSGITQTEHKLNGKGGIVFVTYNTYNFPDRIDVYLDGKWVDGTGSNIAPPPPLSTCDNPLAGFVGKVGQFKFNTTTANKIIQVYVSGCTGKATAWDYTLTCPQ